MNRYIRSISRQPSDVRCMTDVCRLPQVHCTIAYVAPRLSAHANGPAPDRSTRPRRSVRQTVGAYVSLTKPRIIELLLVTTVPTMILAAQGLPSLWLVVATLVGGSLAAATLIRGLFYGVRPWDVRNLMIVVSILIVAALLASYVPARRAASVNPVEALRTE